MTASNITLTGPDTYTATIEGIVWFNITPVSRFYKDVQEAIAAGATVLQAE